MTILKDVYICDAHTYKKTDLRINEENQEIIDIEIDIKAKSHEKVIYLNNKIIMPSFIDLNIKLKNNKLTSKNIIKLEQKAKQAGISEICISPESEPSISDTMSLEMIQANSKLQNFLCVLGYNNDALNDISILSHKGAQALSITSDINEQLYLKIFQYATMHNLTILFNSFNKHNEQGYMIRSKTSSLLGIYEINPIKEYSNIAKVLEYARVFKTQIVLNSIIDTRSLELIKQANLENVYSQVSIHHLILDESTCKDYNTLAKIYPPLASSTMKEKLIQDLKKDKIHMLTSLESEVSLLGKDTTFDEAKFGISSINEYFPLIWTYLVKTNIITLSKASELLSYNPSKITKNPNALIQKGIYKDLIMIEKDYSFIVDNELSPYNKNKLYSKVSRLYEYLQTK